MLRQLLIINQLSLSLKVNHLLYWLRKLPFIKKIIPNTLYQQTAVKRGLGVIVMIGSIFLAFVRKLIYTFVFFFVVSFLLADFFGVVPMIESNHLQTSLFMYQFMLISFLLGSLISTSIHTSNDYVFVRLMNVNPSIYYKNNIYLNIINDGIGFFIVFLLFGLGFINSILFTIGLIGSRLVGEVISLFDFSLKTKQVTLTGKPTNSTLPLPPVRFYLKSIYILIPFVIIVYSICYLLPYQHLELIMFSTSYCAIITFLIFGFLGVLSYLFLMKYSGYGTVAKCLIRLEDVLELEDITQNTLSMDVTLTEKDAKRIKKSGKSFDSLYGYQYLNAIFFERYYHLVATPLKWKIIINSGIIVLGVIASFVPIVRQYDGVWLAITSLTPFLVLYMYWDSIGPRITKAFFFNCDVSLLKYGYYRKKTAVLENFKIRLRYIIKFSFLPSSILSLGVVLLTILNGHQNDMIIALSIGATIILLSIFFSMFHLLLYYLLQPYTEDNSLKSPLFSFLNGLLYFLCYFSSQFRTSSIWFPIGILIITIIFIPISYILIITFAPKTFKIR